VTVRAAGAARTGSSVARSRARWLD